MSAARIKARSERASLCSRWLRRSTSGLCVIGLACGGAQFDGTVYRDDEVAYAVGRPGEGWEAASLDGQNDVAWVNRGSAAVLQVNGTCDPALDIPLLALTQHLLIGFTEREDRQETLLALAGREALRTEISAKLDGVTRKLVLVVLKKNGCVYDFSLTMVPGREEDAGRRALEVVLKGFRIVDGAGVRESAAAREGAS